MIEMTVRLGEHGRNLGPFHFVAVPSAGDRVGGIDGEMYRVVRVNHFVVGRTPGEFDLQAPTAHVIVELV